VGILHDFYSEINSRHVGVAGDKLEGWMTKCGSLKTSVGREKKEVHNREESRVA